MSPKNNLVTFKKAQDQMASALAAYKPSKTIERIEIKIHPVDMLSWLSFQKDEVKIYGANQSDSMSIAGIGQAVCVRASRLGSYKKVFKQLKSFLSLKYPYLQWYGGFCFDDRHLDEDWKEFGAYRFVLPRFELAAQSGKMIFCCNLMGRENIADVLKQLGRIAIASEKFGKGNSIVRRSDKPDLKLWEKDVERILMDAAVKKVVLARKTSLNFKQTPDCWAMLRQLKAVVPDSYHFAFQFKKTVFLGASPERLYRRYQRSIESEALAGTMPKSTDPKILLSSDKNRHEHAFVVDAIDASFKEFCTCFSRQKRPGILTLPNGHHLITKFQGQLKDGINDEDILQSLHPTPALGGVPRKHAMVIIRKLEGFSRGWYGAPIGYVGLDWAEFVVGIRSGLACRKKLSVFAGAGIVQGSEAKSEWDEVENKISNFIKIIR
ncbi:MAG: isochorismate synthase [Candidatus Omnitrophica bacterium]|nr:isochorismate synthase [Candidatus Omnitrophota bacterium]